MVGDVISEKYSIQDIERGLDSLAETITADENGRVLLPMYNWLERQLEARKAQQQTMSSIEMRVRKLATSRQIENYNGTATE